MPATTADAAAPVPRGRKRSGRDSTAPSSEQPREIGNGWPCAEFCKKPGDAQASSCARRDVPVFALRCREAFGFRPHLPRGIGQSENKTPGSMDWRPGAQKYFPARILKHAGALRNRPGKYPLHAGALRKSAFRIQEQAPELRNRPVEVLLHAGALRKTTGGQPIHAGALRNRASKHQEQAGAFRNRAVGHPSWKIFSRFQTENLRFHLQDARFSTSPNSSLLIFNS